MTDRGKTREKEVSQATPDICIEFAQNEVPQHHTQLSRGLKSRHIQFIALGGTIGTGLFLGIGGALNQAGPLSLFLGYAFTSTAIWAMVITNPAHLVFYT